jgi:hypothetical protein
VSYFYNSAPAVSRFGPIRLEIAIADASFGLGVPMNGVLNMNAIAIMKRTKQLSFHGTNVSI